MAFPNSIQLSEEQIVTTSATQALPLGTRGFTNDGRVFRYAQAGAVALTAHKLVISPVETDLATATVQVFYEAYPVGTTFVKVDCATEGAAHILKDGWLVVNSTDTTYNQVVPIFDNEALVTSTALNQLTGIWLKKPGLKKLTATSTAIAKLVQNPYKGLLVSTDANGPGAPMGITPVAVTASYYFWVQTWGPAMAHAGEGSGVSIDTKAGKPVGWSTGSTGGVCGSTALSIDTDSGFTLTAGRVGVVITAAPAANFFHLIDLRLSP